MAKESEFKDGQKTFLEKDFSIWNVEDTSDETPPQEDNGSWTAYWKRITQKDIPQKCPVCDSGLNKDNTTGAHVRLKTSPEDEWAWIAILCDGCNNWQNRREMKLKKN